MTERPLKLKIEYDQHVRRAYGNGLSKERFSGSALVMLRTITTDQAPVAYRVRPGRAHFEPSSDLDYVIRSFEGRLWWPAWWDGRMIDRSEFERSAAGGTTHAATAIDPTSGYRWPEYPEIEDRPREIKERGESTEDSRIASAQRGALRVLACDERIYVEAGGPVFYGVAVDGGIDLVIGPSDWQRLTPVQVLPGPDSSDGERSALAGRVFGIDDVEHHVQSLCMLGYGIRHRAEIDTVSPCHGTDAAIRLRAKVIAEQIYISARDGLSVQKRALLLPSMFDRDGMRLDDDRIDAFVVLAEVIAIAKPGEVRWFREEIPGAEAVLAALPLVVSPDLTAEDEEAVASLGL
jgi:hypothetical protein